MKRQRSRNRKPSGNQNNPNRAYESNGPDGAKVRGNAQTIYEKYQQLARDANSSGDRVLAENYLQHAEHYFRLIRQMQPQRPVSEFLQRDPFSTGFDFDEDLDGEPVETAETEGEPPEADGGEGDQPRYENRRDRDRNDRDRNRDRDRNDRDRNDRDRGDRNRDRDDRNGDRNANAERAPNADRDNGDDRPRRESRRERYERRRQQRLTDQEDTAPSGHIASTEPLGTAPAAPEVAGFEVVTPQATPIAPVAETPAAEAQPEPRTRGRRRNVEAEAPAESLGGSHLPAFLRVPVPAAAPETPAGVVAEEGEAPKRRTRRKKSEEAEA